LPADIPPNHFGVEKAAEAASRARRTRHHDEDKDPAKIRRVMEALLKMVKLDANALEKAYRGSSAA
jgi:hypothetical protein